MTDFLRLVFAVYAGGVLLGIAGLAVYAAWFTKPAPDTTWVGWWLWRAGHAIVAVGLAMLAGLFLAAVIVGALHVLR